MDAETKGRLVSRDDVLRIVEKVLATHQTVQPSSKKKKSEKGKHRVAGGKIVNVKQTHWQKYLPLIRLTCADLRKKYMLKGTGGLDLQSLKANRKRDIPWLESAFGKGTAIPVLALPMVQNNITVVAATQLLYAAPIEFDVFTDYADLQLIFDEYRPLHGHVEYHANQAAWNIATDTELFLLSVIGVASIDYDDATAPPSRSSVVGYDTRKFFQALLFSGIVENIPRWPILFDWLPDTEWLTTATANVAFAAWKMELSASHNASSSVIGELHGRMSFQFRLLF